MPKNDESSPELSLAGQTLRWTFDSGPTADKTYEHTFKEDGTVEYHEANAKPDEAKKKAAPAKQAADAKKPEPKKTPTNYASFEVGEDLHLVSYLSEMGYTLTVFVNMNDDRLYGFASNDKEWFPLTGTQDQAG